MSNKKIWHVKSSARGLVKYFVKKDAVHSNSLSDVHAENYTIEDVKEMKREQLFNACADE